MVPVLGAVPFETIVWVILLLVGVISSIVSSARKAVKAARPPSASAVVRQAFQATVPPTVPERTPNVIESTPSVILSLSKDAVTQARRETVPPVAVRQAHQAPGGGTRAFRGMFERGSLVRAIVAAEVLGPPKALQEQSIWSPRHSEPSI